MLYFIFLTKGSEESGTGVAGGIVNQNYFNIDIGMINGYF